MTDAVYRIVEHDGGWAYKLGDVFSETFSTRGVAEAMANVAAEAQRMAGEDEAISWEDEAGRWHDEAARGNDRPNAYVAGSSGAPSRAGSTSSGPHGHLGAGDQRGKGVPRATTIVREKMRSDPLLVMLLAAISGFIIGALVRKSARQAPWPLDRM